MNYTEKLKDPRWQKKRLEILQRDNWKCVSCGNRDETLFVHHITYNKGSEGPWDYDNTQLLTLCEACHYECHESPYYLPALYQQFINDGNLSFQKVLELWKTGKLILWEKDI